MKLKKFVTKRLPSPIPSKCSNKSRYHYFPGDYNREPCLSVNRHIEIFRKYVIWNDISEKYVTDLFKDNRNLSKVKKGYVKEFRLRYKEVGLNNNLCPFACFETTYEVISSLMDDANIKNPQIHVPQFHYDKSEKLGLMAGASALSFLELLIYIILRFVNAMISWNHDRDSAFAKFSKKLF